MALEDAALEAARTGQVTWFLELFYPFGSMPNSILSNCLVVAATNNRLEMVVQFLVRVAPTRQAVERGYLDIVQWLIPYILEMTRRVQGSLNGANEMYLLMHPVLDVAAAKGHLEVVKLLVEHVIYAQYAHHFALMNTGDALSYAILYGHTEVVEFLLPLKQFNWDLAVAFLTAIFKENRTLAERIYAYFPAANDGGNLLVVVDD